MIAGFGVCRGGEEGDGTGEGSGWEGREVSLDSE
jgi:hypothetical protein